MSSTGCGRCWIVCGAILAGLAVVLGAFAAHGLDGYFVKKYAGETRTVAGVEQPRAVKALTDFRTGAEYQMTHALALIAVGLLLRSCPGQRCLNAAGWCFLAGIVLFSGSLYALTLTGITKLGAVAPFGGTAFVAGWVLAACGAYRGTATAASTD